MAVKEQRIKNELKKATEGVGAQLARLENLLRVYDNEDAPTAAHVGSMEHAETTLTELCERLLDEYSM